MAIDMDRDGETVDIQSLHLDDNASVEDATANATAANATAANATRLVEDAVQDGDVNACKWPCLVLLFVISLCL